MKTYFFSLLAACFLLPSIGRAGSHVKVVTSTTDLAWAVREIGGEHVEVQSLLRGTENPHYVDAVPEFVRLVAEAQVVCVVGLELEVGWMPKVLSRSSNASVNPGGQGYCETGKRVQILERMTTAVDRSMGDIHPAGNPHFWLSPKAFGDVAGEIVASLSAVDPSHIMEYRAGAKKFVQTLKDVHAHQLARIKPVVSQAKGPLLMEYHKEFAYFLDAYGLESLGSVEEKPGVAPSAGRLAEVALSAKAAGVRFVLASENAPKKTLERFTELSGIPVVTVPMSIQPRKGPKNFAELQEKLVDSVLQALKTPAG